MAIHPPRLSCGHAGGGGRCKYVRSDEDSQCRRASSRAEVEAILVSRDSLPMIGRAVAIHTSLVKRELHLSFLL